MKKVSILMAFLITGYVLGIWNFLVMPKYYMTFGMKGFLISLLPVLIAMFLIYSEVESTKRTRYLIYELFFKVARTPAFIFTLLMFLMIMVGVTSYFSGWALIYLFGVDKSYVALFAMLTVIIAALLLLMAKGKVLEFISGVSVISIIFTLISAFLIKREALSVITSDQAKYYMNQALSSITSFHQPLSFEGVIVLLTGIIVAFGLGAGVYYVLGSFAPEDLDFKKVLVAVFIIQAILSFAVAYTMAYSLGPAFQAFEKGMFNPNIPPKEAIKLGIQFGALKEYATNSTTPLPQSIGVFYTIPEIIKGNIPGSGTIIALLVLSLYFFGLTSIIVLLEMGGQMLSEVMQLPRAKSLGVIGFIGIILGAIMTMTFVRIMFLMVPFSVGALVALIEAYPLFSTELTANKTILGIIMVILGIIGLASLYYAFTGPSDAMKLGAVLGLVLFVPVFMNNMLLKVRR
ncbi:sodium-dependent transporter [Thermococcus sp.]